MSEEDGNTRLPEFVGQVPNVTVQVGREARLPCIIRNLATYRVSEGKAIACLLQIAIANHCHHLIEL